MDSFDTNYPRFRLRVLEKSQVVFDANDYQIYLTLLYSASKPEGS